MVRPARRDLDEGHGHDKMVVSGSGFGHFRTDRRSPIFMTITHINSLSQLDGILSKDKDKLSVSSSNNLSAS